MGPQTLPKIFKNCNIETESNNDEVEWKTIDLGNNIQYRGMKKLKLEKVGKSKVKTSVITPGYVKAEIGQRGIYEGQFIGDIGNSYAKIIFPSGNYYIGMFKIIKAHG